MLGLLKGTVRLVPHTEVWHQLFVEEAIRLRNAIGEHAVAIEHMGSTAVCGLAAKPILDIGVSLARLSDGVACINTIENIGYEYRGEAGIAGRFYFVKGEPRTHHLHMVEAGSEFWKRHLLFRDYLLNHSDVAKKYEKLKLELAQKYSHDREAYTLGKSAFIEGVVMAAGLR